MSKNIRGLTQAVVNVSQINFIDALFNTVTAVNINGTTAEITGTLTVNNLVITGTFTLTGGIDVDGVTTTTLTLTSIPQDNTDTINRNLLFIGADDNVHQHSTLNFNQSTQELRCQELVVNGDITGDLTGAVNIQTTAPTNTGAFRVPFIDGVNDGVTSTGNGLMSSSNKLRFDESTGTLIISNYVTAPILAATTYALITPTTSTADLEYKITMFGNGNALTGDTMTYNCFQNRLTVDNLQVTGGLQITPSTSTADIEYEVSFFGLNNVLTGDTTMTFNPLDNRLTVTDLQVTDDVTIDDDLTVTGSTSLGVGLKIQTLNSFISETCRLLCWDNAGSISSKPVVTKDTLYYVGSTDTLHTPNVTATGDMDISGNISICSKQTTASSELCRILFLDGSSDIGTNYDIVRDTLLYYIPNSSTLVSNALRGQVQMISPLFVTLGATFNSTNGGMGIYDDGTAVRNRYFHANGHIFMDGNAINSNNLFMTNPTQTRVYNPLQCDDVLTLNSVPTAPINANTDILLLDSSTNQITKSGITFSPSGGVLSTGNITLTGALSALVVATTGNVDIGGTLDVTNDMTVSGTFTGGDINFDNLYGISASGKITVQQPIHYGGGAFIQPLNYTIRIGTTDLIRTIDTASGTGFNSGRYGNGVTLSILRSGVKTTSYGQNSEIITWNPYIDATNTATNFTLGGLPGLWDIKMTCKFTTAQAGNSNRVNPIVRAVLNNTTTIDGGDQSSYIRHNVGRVGCIVWHNKIYLNTTDSIRFDTYTNFGAVIDFTSIIASTDFDLSDFMFIATFLGPLDEYDKTPA